MCVVNELPNELLVSVFSFLDASALCRVAQVCRRWREVSGCNALWGVRYREASTVFREDEYKDVRAQVAAACGKRKRTTVQWSEVCQRAALESRRLQDSLWKRVYARKWRARHRWMVGAPVRLEVLPAYPMAEVSVDRLQLTADCVLGVVSPSWARAREEVHHSRLFRIALRRPRYLFPLATPVEGSGILALEQDGDCAPAHTGARTTRSSAAVAAHALPLFCYHNHKSGKCIPVERLAERAEVDQTNPGPQRSGPHGVHRSRGGGGGGSDQEHSEASDEDLSEASDEDRSGGSEEGFVPVSSSSEGEGALSLVDFASSDLEEEEEEEEGEHEHDDSDLLVNAGSSGLVWLFGRFCVCSGCVALSLSRTLSRLLWQSSSSHRHLLHVAGQRILSVCIEYGWCAIAEPHRITVWDDACTTLSAVVHEFDVERHAAETLLEFLDAQHLAIGRHHTIVWVPGACMEIGVVVLCFIHYFSLSVLAPLLLLAALLGLLA
jgi:nucleotide-binding universal stress UspA family protein